MTSDGVSNSPPLPIVFYRSTQPQPDDRGRTLEQILSWSNFALEKSHNYIQYLFPIPERSPINPFAPPVTQEVFEAFRADTPEGHGLRINLRRAFERMLAFYGFKLVGLDSSLFLTEDQQQQAGAWKVRRSDDYAARFPEWVRPFDHNHMRITRIIRCLRLLGLEAEALAFYEALEGLTISSDQYGKIGKKSFRFWRRAATRQLWNAPEDEDGIVGEGCEFLVDWEGKKADSEVQERTTEDEGMNG